MVVEAVAGMDLQPRGARQGGALTIRCHSASAFAVWPSTTASHQPPVWISITGARNLAAISICCGIGGDEQRHPDAGIAEPRDEGGQRIVLADHVQPALGGEFLAPLRHQAHGVGFCRERDPQHVLGRRHLEIQRLGYFGLQPSHVAVADVAAILPQMRGDAVGAGLDRSQRGAHRVRPLTAPRVAQGCDVIDVDAEA